MHSEYLEPRQWNMHKSVCVSMHLVAGKEKDAGKEYELERNLIYVSIAQYLNRMKTG